MDNAIIWSPGMTLDALEKQVILKAFRFYRGNKTQTASALGISIRTLDNKLERYAEEKTKEDELQNELQRQRNEYLARSRGVIQRNPETGADVYAPAQGVRVEPAIKPSEKPAMPVQERKEIQSVSPKQVTQNHTGKSGSGLQRANGKG